MAFVFSFSKCTPGHYSNRPIRRKMDIFGLIQRIFAKTPALNFTISEKHYNLVANFR